MCIVLTRKSIRAAGSALCGGGRNGFGSELAVGFAFKLLDLYFGLNKAGLTILREAGAFLISGQKSFQREIIVFHGIDNPLEAF